MAIFGRRLREEPLMLDIDLDEVPEDRPPLIDYGWLVSSYELRCGLRVIEQPFETLPGELQEALVEGQSRKRRSWLDDEPDAFSMRV